MNWFVEILFRLLVLSMLAEIAQSAEHYVLAHAIWHCVKQSLSWLA